MDHFKLSDRFEMIAAYCWDKENNELVFLSMRKVPPEEVPEEVKEHFKAEVKE